MIVRIFKDFYGCYAEIAEWDEDSYNLKVFDHRGNMFHEKEYRTLRGAKIAMGRMSDGWYKVEEVKC